jgi:hypothetical protein
MNRGRLLALDAPSALKREVVRGETWDVVAQPLVAALEALARLPGVRQAGLLGDHLHAVTEAGAQTAEGLRAGLKAAGFEAAVERAEVTLEDVFTELAVR